MLFKWLLFFAILYVQSMSSATECAISQDAKIKKILFFGHIYGAPNRKSPFPSSSAISAIDIINTENADQIVLLGDNVDIANKKSYSLLKKMFLEKIQTNIVVIPGNHDRVQIDNFNSELYEFSVKKRCIIQKDNAFVYISEKIHPENLVKEIKTIMKQNISLRNLFVFTHENLWLEQEEEIFFRSHERFKSSFTNRLKEILSDFPYLNISLITGDLAFGCNAPVLFKRDRRANYIAVGNSNSDCDHIGVIEIEENKGLPISERIYLYKISSKEKVSPYSYDIDNVYINSKNLSKLGTIEKFLAFFVYPRIAFFFFIILWFNHILDSQKNI